MIDRLQEFGIWPSKPGVRWFHFWNPHSGLVGGIISACVIIGFLSAVVFSLSSCQSYQPPCSDCYIGVAKVLGTN